MLTVFTLHAGLSALPGVPPSPLTALRRDGLVSLSQRRSRSERSRIVPDYVVKSSQLPAFSCQPSRVPLRGKLPFLSALSWKLEAGSWKLEAGSFQLNILQTVVSSFHDSTQHLRAFAVDLAIGSDKGIMVKPHG